MANPFKVAVITGLATELTTLEVTVNVAVVAAVATVTRTGTVASAELPVKSDIRRLRAAGSKRLGLS